MNLTIEEIEAKYFDIPSKEDVSYLVWRVYTLRKKLICQFTVEDLRIMIGQNQCLKYLIPRAIEILDKDLFVSGDYYPGDLLFVVLKSDIQYWLNNPVERNSVERLVSRIKQKMEIITLTNENKSKLIKATEEFLSLQIL